MPFIDWEEDYTVHHEEMDRHHRYLVDQINNLHEAILSNRVQDEVQTILEKLYSYTKFHFEAEERLIKDFDLAESEEHHKSHIYLTERVRELKDKFYRDTDFNVFELMGFLRTWLIEHIVQEDKPIFTKFIDRATEQGERHVRNNLGKAVQS